MTSTPGAEHLASPIGLVVAVKYQGVLLPRARDHDEVLLDLDGLRSLHHLAAGGAVDASVPLDLAEALRARGLLVTDSAAGPGPSTEAADASTAVADAPEHEPLSPPSGELVLTVPALLRSHPGGFEFVDHQGRVRARLLPIELLAAAAFRAPTLLETAHGQHVGQCGDRALADVDFAALVERLRSAGLLVTFDPDDPVHATRTRQAEAMAEGMRRQLRVHQEFDRLEAEYDAAAGSADRVPVVGFHTSWSGLPASLGMLVAAAKGHDGGVLEASYSFRPRLYWDRSRLEAQASGRPGIYLFSNYIWSTPGNLSHSALVKELSPHSVTIHGGPDTPKYPEDTERYFADNPHVDIAVHGEGEATFVHLLQALRGHVGDGPPDLGALADVPGLSYRDGDRVVRTESRDRITDLDKLPSPLLTGLFDGFVPAGPLGAVVLETNRGCPYGCTFCDWGSATLSRIRKFDLDRVFAELEWCADHEFETVGIADANFGILERDVEIAEHIAALKTTHGYPRFVGNNYAKNTVKHLARIIEVFTQAGIVAEGKMSMQTFDADTLISIRRKNIKVERYHDLAAEFGRNELPMVVDIMVGLPGGTPETFKSDLQECISRGVRAAIHTTILLPNSPMNDPEYRAEHGIVARAGEEVRQTSSYTREEWDHMTRLMWSFYVLENFGVLRQVATYVRSETGQREIDFYERFVIDVSEAPHEWPIAAVVLDVLPEMMVPPVSWQLFMGEVHRYLVDRVGMPDDDALRSVLAVQLALQPSRDRSFPLELDLEHDYASWYRTIVELRGSGHLHDWPDVIEPLRSYGRGRFTVDDPFDVCTSALGGSVRSLVVENAWDLDSPVSRPRQRLATVGDPEVPGELVGAQRADSTSR